MIKNNTLHLHSSVCIRDRPFNLKGGVMVICFVQKMFFGQHKRQNIILFCRAKREIFFRNLTLGYMTKTLNHIIFFSSTKIRIFFSATLGIRIFFQKKPFQVKWSFPNVTIIVQSMFQLYRKILYKHIVENVGNIILVYLVVLKPQFFLLSEFNLNPFSFCLIV